MSTLLRDNCPRDIQDNSNKVFMLNCEGKIAISYTSHPIEIESETKSKSMLGLNSPVLTPCFKLDCTIMPRRSYS